MKHFRHYIRKLIIEATEYDSKFSQLMAGGLEGIEQAFQLADTMGIPTQELPWTLDMVSKYIDEQGQKNYPDGGWGQHYAELLEPTGWSIEKWKAELRRREEENDRMWAEKYGETNEQAARQYIRLLLEQGGLPKVIFMAGGPGSGKSTVIRSLGLAGRMEIINPDDAYEAGLRAEGIPMDRESLLDEYKPIKDAYLKAKDSGDLETASDLEPEYLRLRGLLSRNMQLFATARKDARSKQLELLETGKDFLVDGTGGNRKEILSLANKLRNAGFDVGMIYIDVPMETSVDRDRRRGDSGGRRLGRRTVEKSWSSVNKNLEFYQQYFGKNFFYIDASEDNFKSSIQNISSNVGAFLQ